MKEFENEIPKYKKKRQSSTSKSYNKSNHKHNHDGMCIAKYPPFIQGGNHHMTLTTYCTECGRIIDSIAPTVNEDFTNKNGEVIKRNRLLSREEILEKYKQLEIVEMSEHFQKYIPIVRSDCND